MHMNAKALLACLLITTTAVNAFPYGSRPTGPEVPRIGYPVAQYLLTPDRAIPDYHKHHLQKPPANYHWIHGDGDMYILISDKTGIARDITTRPG